MLSFLPSPLKGLLASLLLLLNTILWCSLMGPFQLIKVLSPVPTIKKFCTRVMIHLGENWIRTNNLGIRLMHQIQWQVRGLEGLSPRASYLICVNHQSWVDIVILQHVFNGRIPFIRFFLKSELAWVPFLNLAWWALDFPFMRRYSATYLQKHPEKRGRDLEITREACEKFRGSPVSILNFLEGTRFTPEKKQKTSSPYAHLLVPKTGGVAFVLQAMGEQFESVLDVTIFYPGRVPSLWDLLSGKLHRVQVDIAALPVPQDLASPVLRNWVRGIWEKKDERLKFLHQAH